MRKAYIARVPVGDNKDEIITLRRYNPEAIRALVHAITSSQGPDGWASINIYDIPNLPPVSTSWVGITLSRFSRCTPLWIEMENDYSKPYVRHLTRYRRVRITEAGFRAFASVGVAVPAPVKHEEKVIEDPTKEAVWSEEDRPGRLYPFLWALAAELSHLNKELNSPVTCGHEADLRELADLRAWRALLLDTIR